MSHRHGAIPEAVSIATKLSENLVSLIELARGGQGVGWTQATEGLQKAIDQTAGLCALLKALDQDAASDDRALLAREMSLCRQHLSTLRVLLHQAIEIRQAHWSGAAGDDSFAIPGAFAAGPSNQPRPRLVRKLA